MATRQVASQFRLNRLLCIEIILLQITSQRKLERAQGRDVTDTLIVICVSTIVFYMDTRYQ